MQRIGMLVVVGVTGCAAPQAFNCSEDSQCGAQGVCEPNGYCSMPDTECLSGRVWADSADDEFAGVCLPGEEAPPEAPDQEPSGDPAPEADPEPEGCNDDGLASPGELCPLQTTVYALPSAPQSVVVVDVSRDGLPDLVASLPQDGAVAVLRGEVSGSFEAPVVQAVSGTPTELAAGVLGGGAVVFASDEKGLLRLSDYADGGSFIVESVDLPGPVSDLLLGDFDRDDSLDAVATSAADASATVITNFGGDPTVTTHDVQDDASRVSMADLDGDGNVDVVVLTEGAGGAVLWTFHGVAGGLNDPKPMPCDRTLHDVAVVDLDGNGTTEVIGAPRGGGALQVLIGGGWKSLPTRVEPASTLAVADINADGLPDLVAVSGTVDSVVEVALGDGEGGLAAGRAVGTWDADASDVAIADLDADGFDEVIAVGERGVAVFRGIGY